MFAIRVNADTYSYFVTDTGDSWGETGRTLNPAKAARFDSENWARMVAEGMSNRGEISHGWEIRKIS